MMVSIIVWGLILLILGVGATYVHDHVKACGAELDANAKARKDAQTKMFDAAKQLGTRPLRSTSPRRSVQKVANEAETTANEIRAMIEEIKKAKIETKKEKRNSTMTVEEFIKKFELDK
jgi:hypothetical protein